MLTNSPACCSPKADAPRRADAPHLPLDAHSLQGCQVAAALARSVHTGVEVIREGLPPRLPSEQLVPGDLVSLEACNKVPADLRLLQARHLKVDESSFTGASMTILLRAVLGLDLPVTALQVL